MAAADGLAFFGQMSASISHELKNTISIMNESAGLLEDLSAIAEKGGDIDTAKVKRLSQTIRHQIKRTNDIIGNMNRFSHLVDEPFRQIETAGFLRFVVDISRRLTASAGVEVVVEDAEKPLNIVTRPFYLHYLVWLTIQYCINNPGVTGDLKLHAKPAADGVNIIFTGLKTVPDKPEAHFSAQREKTLIGLLGAEIQKKSSPENALILFLPETADKQTAENSHTG